MGETSHEDIARRAWEISQTEGAGSDEENWHRAEQELRGGEPGDAEGQEIVDIANEAEQA